MRSVVNRRLAVVPVLAAAMFALIACNSSTSGSPNPTTGGGQATTGGNVPTSSAGGTSGSSGSTLTSLQPCQLVSSSVLTELQLTQSSSGTVGGARTCSWTKPVDQNGVNGYTAGVDVRDSQGLGDASTNGYTVSPDQVGSHQGKELQSTTPGDCIVIIGVSQHSRVDVSVNAGTDTAKACQVANQLAKVVEPQLPAGG